MAYATDWTCTWPSFGPRHEPVIVTYKRNLNKLDEISRTGLEEYDVVEETSNSLLAVKYDEVSVKNALVAFAFIVMINKISGDFTRDMITVPNEHGARASGSCIAQQ
jgi:hypothetical protein